MSDSIKRIPVTPACTGGGGKQLLRQQRELNSIISDGSEIEMSNTPNKFSKGTKVGSMGNKAGMQSPGVSVGKIDREKMKTAKKLNAQLYPNTGMWQVNTGVQPSLYRTSYMNAGLATGAFGDVPLYFVLMNEQNGGIIYWPVTLKEKYSWYRYFYRCLFADKDLCHILMANGTLKDIRDIEKGEQLITGIGTIKTVRETFKRKVKGKSVKIKAMGLQNPITSTHHHPFYVLDNRQVEVKGGNGKKLVQKDIDFKPEWVHAENIKKGDYVLMPTYNDKIDNSINEIKGRLLGYYAAEGSIVWGERCIGTEKNGKGYKWGQEKKKVPVGVAFTLNKTEKDTVAKAIIDAGLEGFGVEGKIVRERDNHIEVLISSREVGEFCLYHVGVGSLKKKLSKELVKSRKGVKRQFIIGYAEGDGHQNDDKTTNNGKLIIGTSSKDLASQVQFMAISCGLVCRLAKYKRTKNSGYKATLDHYYRLEIPHNSANEIYKDSVRWATIGGEQRNRGALVIGDYVAYKVTQVEINENEEGYVYNLNIDAEGDENSFVCNGMIVHNTDPFVGQAIDLHTDLPLSKLSLHMPEVPKTEAEEVAEKNDSTDATYDKRCKSIKLRYEYMMDKLNLFEVLQQILHEFNVIGNCFPSNHRVHTSDGMLAISEIRKGDLVLTDKEHYKLVTEISRRKVSENLYSFDIDGMLGIEFTPTSEHPIFILQNNKRELKKAKDIEIGDYIEVYSNYILKDMNYKEIDGRFYLKINDISLKYYDGYVYNFEVEEDHTYCVENIMTHNCFIFSEWNENKKIWDRLVILPPEEIQIYPIPFSDISRVEYRPERLMAIVQQVKSSGLFQINEEEEEFLEYVPQEILDMVMEKEAIVLDTDPNSGSFVHHLSRKRTQYMDLGISIIERVLVPLLQKEHYKYTQLGLASRNMTPKNKISAPGLSVPELDDLREQVDLSYLDPDYSIITNYDWTWDLIGADNRLLDLAREYETIENQMMAGLGVTRELLTGEGSYAGSKITVEIINTRYLMTREILQNYVENYLFKPVADAHKDYYIDDFGYRQYLYPKLGFTRLSIRDNQETFDTLFQLYQKGSLPIKVIYELFNLNTNELHKEIEEDLFTVRDSQFNEVIREVYSAGASQLGEGKTDISEKLAKTLGITYEPVQEEGEEGGFGGGFGEEEGGFGEEQDEPETNYKEIEENINEIVEQDKGDNLEVVSDVAVELLQPEVSNGISDKDLEIQVEELVESL